VIDELIIVLYNVLHGSLLCLLHGVMVMIFCACYYLQLLAVTFIYV